MIGPITAEADAVHALAQAVSRYAEHVQNVAAAACAAAQREAARMEQIAEERHQALEQARERVAQAQQALNACMAARRPEGGPDCSAQQSEVEAAQREQEQADAACQRADKAAGIADAAARDLSSAITSVESVITGRSSVAVTGLHELEDRLNRISHFVRTKWVTGAIGLALLDVGHVGVKLSQPFISPQYQVTAAQQDRARAEELVELGLDDQERRAQQWDDVKSRSIPDDQ